MLALIGLGSVYGAKWEGVSIFSYLQSNTCLTQLAYCLSVDSEWALECSNVASNTTQSICNCSCGLTSKGIPTGKAVQVHGTTLML